MSGPESDTHPWELRLSGRSDLERCFRLPWQNAALASTVAPRAKRETRSSSKHENLIWPFVRLLCGQLPEKKDFRNKSNLSNKTRCLNKNPTCSEAGLLNPSSWIPGRLHGLNGLIGHIPFHLWGPHPPQNALQQNKFLECTSNTFLSRILRCQKS